LGACLADSVSKLELESYHPIHSTLVCVELAAFGTKSAAPYHAVSVLLTALLAAVIAAWLLFGEGRDPKIALAAALIAGMHPAMVETEMSIASQKDLLGLIFGVIALWFSAKERPVFSALFVMLAARSKSGYAMFGIIVFARELMIAGRPIKGGLERS